MLATMVPPTVTRLVTLAMARAELSITGTDQDAAIGLLIDQASEAVAGYVARPILRCTVLETIHLAGGAGVEMLRLSVTPVVALASVDSGGDPLDLGMLDLDAQAGLLARRWGCWWESRIEIAYTGGYAAPDPDAATPPTAPFLPADIQRAALDTLRAFHGAVGRDPMLRSESTQDVGSTSYLDPVTGTGGLPPQAAAMLNRYRRLAI